MSKALIYFLKLNVDFNISSFFAIMTLHYKKSFLYSIKK